MPRITDPNVLVIDVESTCWEAPEQPGPNEFSEIIEIGIAVVNTQTLKMVENDSIIVRPQNSRVSKFCTKLTTLTQDYVDQGMTFQAAAKVLRDQYLSENRTFVSWGDYDRKMFEKNSKSYGVKYPFGPRHMNLKNCFAMLHGLAREPGMDTALEHLKLKLSGTHHRGIDDARNIAKILTHTLEKFRDGKNPISIEIDPRVRAAILDRDSRTDRYGEDFVYLVMSDLCDPDYVARWMPGHEEGCRLFQALSDEEQIYTINKVVP
jgi:inhibitor of KinA sporulation pathway (predicted exonuclease)